VNLAGVAHILDSKAQHRVTSRQRQLKADAPRRHARHNTKTSLTRSYAESNHQPDAGGAATLTDHHPLGRYVDPQPAQRAPVGVGSCSACLRQIVEIVKAAREVEMSSLAQSRHPKQSRDPRGGK
jgi:hypothetical protein